MFKPGNENPNCDGQQCSKRNGEVRTLPHGTNPNHGNSILCRTCFGREIRFRIERNKELAADCRYDLPKWEDLKVYLDAEGKQPA